MRHLLKDKNYALLTTKAFRDENYNHTFVTRNISEAIFLSGTTASNAMNFPLYLYPDNNAERIPNLNPDEIKAFEKALKLPFVADKEKGTESFAPIDILDYIYAVLHSPSYRDKYKEFLKTDFPRVPYPKPKTFWQLVALGGEIRTLHLMESPTLDNIISPYPEAGDNLITRKITKTSPGYEASSDSHGKVWINDKQYFENVPLLAWEFYIGGYQPAQKWLKDRKGRTLSFDDIQHYQKIIVALTETQRLMQSVDEVLDVGLV
jgi:predicted helicase